MPTGIFIFFSIKNYKYGHGVGWKPKRASHTKHHHHRQLQCLLKSSMPRLENDVHMGVCASVGVLVFLSRPEYPARKKSASSIWFNRIFVSRQYFSSSRLLDGFFRRVMGFSAERMIWLSRGKQLKKSWESTVQPWHFSNERRNSVFLIKLKRKFLRSGHRKNDGSSVAQWQMATSHLSTGYHSSSTNNAIFLFERICVR